MSLALSQNVTGLGITLLPDAAAKYFHRVFPTVASPPVIELFGPLRSDWLCLIPIH